MLRDDIEEEGESVRVRVDVGPDFQADEDSADAFEEDEYDDRSELIVKRESGHHKFSQHGSDTDMSEMEAGNNSKVDEEPYQYPVHPADDDLACVPDIPCGTYTKMGKLYVCGKRRDAHSGVQEPTWVAGPCWPMYAFTNFLIIGISSVAMWAYLPYVHWSFALIGFILVPFVVFALFKTGCTNPGVLKRCSKPPQDASGWRWNDQAQSYYPPNATYCRESQVLVHGYDHFCPWTGTTIAGGNMKYFTLFVSSLSFLCFYVIFLAIVGGAAASMAASRTPP